MQINRINKDNCIIKDKIVKQSCCFAKICDNELSKKHTGVNLFLLHLCLHE